jgi:hypothetical protein
MVAGSTTRRLAAVENKTCTPILDQSLSAILRLEAHAAPELEPPIDFVCLTIE